MELNFNLQHPRPIRNYKFELIMIDESAEIFLSKYTNLESSQVTLSFMNIIKYHEAALAWIYEQKLFRFLMRRK